MSVWETERMDIKANRLDRSFVRYQNEYEDKCLEVLRRGQFILGREVESFEQEFSEFIGVKYCVGLASGLDALEIAFRLLDIGPGDEVIVQSNAYIASVMGITINGASPVFAEPDRYYSLDSCQLESLITEQTRAVLVVHLYGHAAGMDDIVQICKKHGLYLVEDCAQSHGASYGGKKTGTFGDISCFSFYPSKNLGGCGDGGALLTNHSFIAKKAKVIRNYGSQKRYYNSMIGKNSRLDEIQAAFLRVGLKHLEEFNQEHIKIAEYYNSQIKNPLIKLPEVRENMRPVWHQYVIQCEKRNHLMEYLNHFGIQTLIHYPIPPHLQDAYQYLGYHRGDFPIAENFADIVLSLPMYIGITKEEQKYVVDKLNEYRGG